MKGNNHKSKTQAKVSPKVKDKKKKKKPSKLLLFAFFMILAGVILLIYPIVGDFLANQQRSKATSEYDDIVASMSKEERNQQIELAKKYNKYIFNSQQGKASKSDRIDYKQLINGSGVMGTIDVPALNISKMPFYHGTDYTTLNRGLGHFEQSSVPIGGENTRSVITGHSGIKNQVLFTDIKNLEVGDIFFINILGERLAYQIESFEEILPSQVDKVKIVPGKDMVTLLTCTPPGINTFRLLVNGVRIPYKDAMAKSVKMRNLFSYKNIVIFSLSLCLIVFLILWIWYKILRHVLKKNEENRNQKKIYRTRRRLHHLFILTKSLFVTLVLSMITVLVVAIYGYYQVRTQQEVSTISVGEDGQLADYNLQKIAKANYTETDIASVNISNFSKSKLNYQKGVNDWGIGKLTIPSIDLNLPILAGMSNENLMNGACTLEESKQLGRGNYVLLAHYVNGADVLFVDIDKLQPGATIYASDFKNVYEYKVLTNELVHMSKVELLEQQPNQLKPLITLIRCEGPIGTVKRRVVQGELSKITPIKDTQKVTLQTMGLDTNKVDKDGAVLTKDPLDDVNAFTMNVASLIIADPLQTIIPIFFLLIVPIIFLNIIR